MQTRWCAIWLSLVAVVGGKVVEVGNDPSLRSVIAKLEAGTTLKIAPGQYRGGLPMQGA